MSVRAKFTCTTVSGKDGDGPISVSMIPVYSGSEENKQFFASTPGGSIGLSVLNREAGLQFEQGKEYYVDFTLATPPAAAGEEAATEGSAAAAKAE